MCVHAVCVCVGACVCMHVYAHIIYKCMREHVYVAIAEVYGYISIHNYIVAIATYKLKVRLVYCTVTT